MKPRPFNAYFFPRGGSGIWTLAVLANSLKSLGCRWFVRIQRTIARFKNCRVVREVELVVVVDCGSAIGAGAGVEETVTELAGGVAACGAAAWELPGLSQPAVVPTTNRNNTSAELGHRQSLLNSSENGLIARVDLQQT